MKIMKLMACASLLVVASASAGTCRAVSDREVQKIAKSEGIDSIWHQTVEYAPSDDTDHYIYLYTHPDQLVPGFCSSREIGLGIKVNGRKSKVVHRQEARQLAFQDCAGVGLDDFHRVDVSNNGLEVPMKEVAELLRDGLPMLGGTPLAVDSSDDQLRIYFDSISKSDLSHVTVRSSKTVSAMFHVKGIAPSLLEVVLNRKEDDSVHVSLDLDYLTEVAQ